MNYTDIETAAAEPCASSMILTFRAIGYNLETAVADVIDNSISADAKNIWFNSEWKGGNSVISILDDGCGMNNDELIQAMKPGAKNPNDERDEKDLGRFGLGLKTASFSQCKNLIVVSKKEDFDTIVNMVNKDISVIENFNNQNKDKDEVVINEEYIKSIHDLHVLTQTISFDSVTYLLSIMENKLFENDIEVF